LNEQLLYARWLDIGTRIGMALLIASFAVYVFGWLDPHVAHADLARLWTLPVERFVAQTGAPTGWAWLEHLHKGDYLNFLGVVVFTTITLVCYARIIPALPRLQAALAAIQIAVLLAAAWL
jgi:hypothetical protein